MKHPLPTQTSTRDDARSGGVTIFAVPKHLQIMTHHMKIFIFQFWHKFLHRAIIHRDDLMTAHADRIMLMLETVELIHCHFIIHHVGFNHHAFPNKKFQDAIDGRQPSVISAFFHLGKYVGCAQGLLRIFEYREHTFTLPGSFDPCRPVILHFFQSVHLIHWLKKSLLTLSCTRHILPYLPTAPFCGICTFTYSPQCTAVLFP